MYALFAFLPSIGPMEMLIVAFIALLLFGNRLPSTMRSLGRGVVEFKKGIQGIEDDINTSANTPAPTKKESAES